MEVNDSTKGIFTLKNPVVVECYREIGEVKEEFMREINIVEGTVTYFNEGKVALFHVSQVGTTSQGPRPFWLGDMKGLLMMEGSNIRSVQAGAN